MLTCLHTAGDAAKGIFTRAKLPNQTLGLIWNLADRSQKGALTCPEFVVAMHLITCVKNGTLQALPTALPPALYDAAAGRPLARPQERRSTGGRAPSQMPTPPPIAKQFSGTRAQSPLSRQFTPPAALNPNLSGGGEWAITSREKVDFDAQYAKVDRDGKGYITGEEAVPFFSNSRLPEDVLATIWDLADITKSGRLNQDEFAVAMHLIRQQRLRGSGKGLPETLPLSLVPPRMRAQFVASQATLYQPSAVPQPPPPPPPPPPSVPAAASAMEDLFGLDSFGPPPAGPGANALAAASPTPNSFDNSFTSSVKTEPAFIVPESKFIPTSQFGQMLAATTTGGSMSPLPAPPAPSAMDDLLGGEDEQMKKHNPDTIELANLSNQIGTLTKHTQELKNKRSSAEQELNNFDTQKQEIEARLAQLKSQYEREANDVRMVEDRLTASRNEVIRLRQEYAITESSYNELLTKKQELATQLEQDQRENIDMKDRMKMINTENQQLKQQLEKLRLEAKQQKGLVAISKKQLATSATERDKLKSEIDDLRSAAVVQTPSPIPPGSPTFSQASTNPFHRARSPPAAMESPYQSPYPTGNSNLVSQQQQSHPNFDDVFGPSFDNLPTAGAAPTTIFSQTASASEGPFDHSTPPTSPPASSYHNSPSSFDNPPPPSAAAQLTSASLPLHSSRAESVTSSVQVNPPASTQGGNFSRPDTPTNWMNAPAIVDSPARDRDIFAKPAERRESTSMRSDPGTPGFSRSDDNRSPFGAAIAKNLIGPTTAGEEQKGHEKKDPIGLVSSTTNISPMLAAFPSPLRPNATGESTRSNKSVCFAPRQDSFGLNRVDEKAPPASKGDMEAAFASFALPKVNLRGQSTGGSNASSKLDKEFPPIEFPQDDDSDSDIGGGFDDNFTTATPAQVPPSEEPTTGAPPEGAEVGPKPDVPLAIQKSTTSNLFPTDASVFEPPNAPSKSPLSSQLNIFPPPPPPTSSTQPTVTAQPQIDEFDDAFGDLAPAQEFDGKGDDDFGISPANDCFDEFNPTFDSLAPKAGAVKSSHLVDDEEFTKFDFNIDTPQAQQQHTGASTKSGVLRATPSQDWDAIFAGLEESKQQPSTTGVATSASNHNNNTVIGESGAHAGTGTDPVFTTTGEGENSGNAGVAEYEEELTKLTGMGFSREDSLKALEKFKYNVESVRIYTRIPSWNVALTKSGRQRITCLIITECCVALQIKIGICVWVFAF